MGSERPEVVDVDLVVLAVDVTGALAHQRPPDQDGLSEALQTDEKASVAALREVFADPLLAGELPADSELSELAASAPDVSAAMVKLFRAYREQAARLSDLSALLARDGRATALSAARLPFDEVSEAMAARPNHFAALEEEAE